MATILRRFDLHCRENMSPFCPLKLLLLYLAFNPTSMLWAALYETGACIPSLCLKYAVIAIANALLATGWLLLVGLLVLLVLVIHMELRA